MKTNKELLDFYGVELGKKYKITKINERYETDWIGKVFIIRTTIVNDLVIDVEQGATIGFSWLQYFDYEKVKPKPLTDEEKDYLKTVIKPFRDRIQRIYKTEAGNFYEGGEVLFFELKLNDYFYLPELPLGKMFSGMEQDKKYTLEELGL